MDALIELILDLFFEIFLGVFSELFDKVVYKVSSNRKAVRVLKIIISIVLLSVAVILLVIAAIKNSGGILGASIIFILCIVLINLFKFMNNNMFKKKWLNILSIVISDIVHYSYYIALFVMADSLGESSKGWIYSIAIICILITFLIDYYRISKNHNKKALEEPKDDEAIEHKEEDNGCKLVFIRNKEHKKRIYIKYSIMAWLSIFIIFAALYTLLACNGVVINDKPKKESLISLLIAFSVGYLMFGSIISLSLLVPLFNESEIIEIKDNKVYFKKYRGYLTIYDYCVGFEDIVLYKGNGIYSIVGLNRICIKLINPKRLSKVYRNKKISICHGVTKEEKSKILEALKLYE